MPASQKKRAYVVFPEDLIHDIDELVGTRGRSAFLAELATREVQRLRLMRLLDRPGPGWKLEEHPELNEGAAAWVSKMRHNDEQIDRET